MPRRKKQKIKLNDVGSLTHLLQETYDDACSQMVDAQKAINGLTNAAEPQDVDDLTKIAKEKGNLLKIKDSAIRVKLEISKLKTAIIDFKGDIDEAVNTLSNGVNLEDFDAVRQIIEEKSKASNNEDYKV